MNEEKKNPEMNEKELEQVNGGAFLDRGSYWSSDYPHRLIVTAGYTCSWFSGNKNSAGYGVCAHCVHSVYESGVLYCQIRKHEDDPVESYHDGWHTTGGRF